MSAFLCILDRAGTAVAPSDLLRLDQPLEAYGSQLTSSCRGPVGIAVRHLARPSATGRGPLVESTGGRIVAVAGRFSPAGDEQLALTPDSIDDQLAGATGAFVLIVADPAQCTVHLARDHLGSHKLYYHLDDRWLVAASEPSAILRHAAVGDEMDERAAARFLGFRFSHDERSFFRHIRELPAGHRLVVTASGSKIERYWRLRSPRTARVRSHEEVLTGFRAGIGRALDDALGDLEPERIALSLSGGLDSTALAALAPRGVHAFSWTFDEVPEGDERANVDALSAHLGLPVQRVSGDGLYPLNGDFSDRFADPSSPYLNPFAALKAELYRAARAAGCTHVMVGDGGDALYAASEYWLRDVLFAGEKGSRESLLLTVRAARAGDRFARLALKRLLPVAGLRSRLRGGPRWLTPAARALLPASRRSPIVPHSTRWRRYELAAGVKHQEIESEERRLFARCGVERLNPFWSWPLLEMVLGLSADWYHRDGASKVLTRQAFRGLLPPRVLDGGRAGLLGSFFLRGLELNRRWIRDAVLGHPRSDWPRYVEREYLESHLAATGRISFGHTILWRVISYELWQRRLIAGPHGPTI